LDVKTPHLPHHGQVAASHHDAVCSGQDVVKVGQPRLALNLADDLDVRRACLNQHLSMGAQQKI
jgi:hypothetical protein